MGTIIKYEWDFGDGNYSYVRSPFHIYKNPGIYTVGLKATHSDGNVKEYINAYYIRVYSIAEAAYDIGNHDDKKCLVFGFGDELGNGWAEFSGDEWMWPESNAAISEIGIGLGVYKVIYDNKTGLPFIINTKDGTADSNIKASLLDKKNEVLMDANFVKTGVNPGYPIKWTCVTPEYVGDQVKFRISHDETFIKMLPMLGRDTIPSENEIKASLLFDGRIIAEQELKYVDEHSEIIFSERNDADRVQIAISGTYAGLRLTNIETTLKTSDVTRMAYRPASVDLQLQLYMSTVSFWWSRIDPNVNMANGTSFTPSPSITRVPGVDLLTDTAFSLTSDYTFQVDPTSVFMTLFWTGSNQIVVEVSGVNKLIKEGDTGVSKVGETGWWFAYVSLTISAGTPTLKFVSGSILYDLRLYQTELTDKAWFDIYKRNITDEQGTKFLQPW